MSSSKNTCRLVIFDLDNTLVDTLAAIVDAFNCAFEPALGRAMSTAEVVAQFGPTEEVVLRRFSPPGREEEIIRRFRDHYDACMKSIPLYPGLDGVLSRLRGAGIPLAVCTGKGRWTTDSTLRQLGLDQSFAVVLSGDDVVRNKPHPDPILEISRRTSVAIEQMVMIGDSFADMKSARDAGATAALVLWGRHETRSQSDDETRRLAHVCFETVAALDGWFRANGFYGR